MFDEVPGRCGLVGGSTSLGWSWRVCGPASLPVCFLCFPHVVRAVTLPASVTVPAACCCAFWTLTSLDCKSKINSFLSFFGLWCFSQQQKSLSCLSCFVSLKKNRNNRNKSRSGTGVVGSLGPLCSRPLSIWSGEGHESSGGFLDADASFLGGWALRKLGRCPGYG